MTPDITAPGDGIENTNPTESSPESDIITSGSQIALKILTSEGEAPLWLGCTGNACKASECPGPTFELRSTVLCQEYIFLIRHAGTSKGESGVAALKTGDQVVLMQLGGSTVYCNQTAFSCMMLPDCRDRSGRFSGELCGNAVMVIKSSRGGVGQVVRHGDNIVLDYLVKSVPLVEWKDTLYCHPKDNGHCERRYCTDYSLQDQQTPGGQYSNGCRLIYTLFKLPL